MKLLKNRPPLSLFSHVEREVRFIVAITKLGCVNCHVRGTQVFETQTRKNKPIFVEIRTWEKYLLSK